MFLGSEMVAREGDFTLVLDKGQTGETELKRTLAQLIFDIGRIWLRQGIEFESQVQNEVNLPAPELTAIAQINYDVEKASDSTTKFFVKSSKPRPAIQASMALHDNDRVYWFAGERFGERLTHAYVEIYPDTGNRAFMHIYPETDKSFKETGKMTFGLVVTLTSREFGHISQVLSGPRLSEPKLQLSIGATCFQEPTEASFAEPWHPKHFVIEANKYIPAQLRSLTLTEQTGALAPKLEVEGELDPADHSETVVADPTAIDVQQLRSAVEKLSERVRWIQVEVGTVVAILLVIWLS